MAGPGAHRRPLERGIGWAAARQKTGGSVPPKPTEVPKPRSRRAGMLSRMKPSAPGLYLYSDPIGGDAQPVLVVDHGGTLAARFQGMDADDGEDIALTDLPGDFRLMQPGPHRYTDETGETLTVEVLERDGQLVVPASEMWHTRYDPVTEIPGTFEPLT